MFLLPPVQRCSFQGRACFRHHSPSFRHIPARKAPARAPARRPPFPSLPAGSGCSTSSSAEKKYGTAEDKDRQAHERIKARERTKSPPQGTGGHTHQKGPASRTRPPSPYLAWPGLARHGPPLLPQQVPSSATSVPFLSLPHPL